MEAAGGQLPGDGAVREGALAGPGAGRRTVPVSKSRLYRRCFIFTVHPVLRPWGPPCRV